ncbi:PREDICTED: uncharacterized protein LOC108565452 [Nicrophorus vespilloides]|uniref:Uncharacterized protein LOC108565452 n=1 Tax=Nicrophorus vespilloides TaxID=110193 RepID=A0ABM1N0R4_NICVS|nr:PREDICTED: uncharacterized protein LOC108565452 [Nicrophorus vespilloides]
MSKSTKADFKKTLVRNTTQSLPKAVVTTKTSGNASRKEDKQIMAKEKKTLNLGLPAINSSKNLVKTMKTVESVQQRKVQESNLALQDEISKRMNFPCDRAIYKELIPVCSKPEQVIAHPARGPLPLKDKEPKLENFIRHKTLPEYTCSAATQSQEWNAVREHDGFKMYRYMQKFS